VIDTEYPEIVEDAVSHYCVLRWYPNIVLGECVNVGILVIGQGKALTRLISDYSRARCLDPHLPSPRFFEAWTARLKEWATTPDAIRRYHESLGSALVSNQIHGPLGALDPVESLLDEMARYWLVEPSS
jgi:hypothetical protein